MSKFTKRMMNSIDYNAVAEKRRANYNYLKSRLGGTPLLDNDVPMIFPYLMENGQELRKDLIKNKVFVAQYWPNVKKWLNSENVETYLANNITFMYYTLITPVKREITGTLKDQIKALYNSQSFTGTTIIEIDGQLPLIIKVRALKGE